MSSMFFYCSSLQSLPDISEWDIRNVTDMSCMFGRCSSLKSLPSLYALKWNTERSFLFLGFKRYLDDNK